MIFASLRRVLAPALALAALTGAAVAQSPACVNWRTELASLQGQRGGDPRAAQAAQRVAGQLSQLSSQYRAMGCDRGGFLFFGQAAPPQCGGIRAQLGALQSQYAQLQQQAQGGGVDQRRAQLAALIDNNCRDQPRRGFFETIFGIEPRRGEIDSTLPELDPDQPREPAENQPKGGPFSVCVRTCDGFFFPLANSPGGREGQDEMCQALCPGTETLAFGMSNGGDIQNAVSRGNGTPYASLPNALKYTKSFDAACACRAPGQSWSQALQNAEQLLDQRKGDIIVTEQRSLEMSRPKPEQPAPPARGKKGATAPEPAPAAPAPTVLQAAPGDEPTPAANVPTASTESAGVGPQKIDGEKTLQQGDGLKRESKSVTGERRTVRIVAPNLAPNLGVGATARP